MIDTTMVRELVSKLANEGELHDLIAHVKSVAQSEGITHRYHHESNLPSNALFKYAQSGAQQ